MSHICIGIDPGKNGGLVSLYGSSIAFRTMPKTDRGVYDWLQQETCQGVTVKTVIEWISSAMKGTSKSSMSKLYGSYRALQMAIACCGLESISVKAAVWQRDVGLSPRKKSEGKSEWKQRLKKRAEELFPSLKITLSTSDALLIAYYCRQLYQEKE